MRLFPATLAFLAISLGMMITEPRWGEPLYRSLAPVVAWTSEVASPDVIYVDPDRAKGPVLVYASNDRKITHLVVGATAESAYALFVALLGAGLLVPPVRARIASRGGIWRVPASIGVLVAAHVVCTVVLIAYTAAFTTHGTIPRALRLLTVGINAGWLVVPFAIFAAFFVRRGQLASGSSGTNASQGAPQSGQIQSSGRSS